MGHPAAYRGDGDGGYLHAGRGWTGSGSGPGCRTPRIRRTTGGCEGMVDETLGVMPVGIDERGRSVTVSVRRGDLEEHTGYPAVAGLSVDGWGHLPPCCWESAELPGGRVAVTLTGPGGAWCGSRRTQGACDGSGASGGPERPESID
ncbi:hypothetical protein [Streptomyces litchfieldiae]|uniref:Uncharacterized protein n=1 Tax=Streptomyces litchfieldiae TaxID=3075543 RepID=A0ABU2MUI0_9ACTN|nr:hypothetical protein [Streptomyces sp. DSM 44938]MDT0344744.1 hypothetical protein [Streptomyces sp. DSM 44938]